MGTTEFTVIEGLKNSNASLQQNDDIRADKDYLSWLKPMTIAMNDIEHGLGCKNTEEDKRYMRFKIASILLAKVLEKEETVLHTTMFEACFEHLLLHIPHLTWNNFFITISRLGLAPEIMELILEMNDEIQDFITNKLFTWLDASIEQQCGYETAEQLTLVEILVLVMAIYISVKLLQKNSDKVENVYDSLKKVLLYLSTASLESKPSSSYNVSCASNMVRRLQSMCSTFKQVNFREKPDMLYLYQIHHSLSESLIRNVGIGDADKTYLASIRRESHKKDIDTDSQKLTTISACSETSNYCAQLIKKSLNCLKNGKNNSLCEILLPLNRTLENICEDKYDEDHHHHHHHHIEYQKKLYIIQHFLNGFRTTTKQLLEEIAESPLLHNMWEDVFDTFLVNPECLAHVDTLIILIRSLSRCTNESSQYSNQQDYIPVLCLFQSLFWAGYQLLNLKCKLYIVEFVISDPQIIRLLSEYPFEESENNASKIVKFKNKRENLAKNFIDSLTNKDKASDFVLDKACDVCISWPEGMIQNLIDHSLKNQQQVELVINLFGHFNCLFNVKTEDSSKSVVWNWYSESMKKFWRNGDSTFVDNGLNFIQKLFNLKNIENHASSFVKETFHSIAEGFADNEGNNLSSKLCLNILSCLIETHAFFDNTTIEELLSLCVCLGVEIDSSRHFSRSNVDFNSERHELLIECFEYLVCKIVDVLQNSYLTNQKILIQFVHKAIAEFTWTTKLRYLPIFKLDSSIRIRVPGCLAEVCKLPEILQASEELSYGAGTGLLAWHQCFVINPSLCPLASLDISQLAPKEIKLFTHGWTVTLAQVLPFCLPHEWHTLIEITKILLSECKLHVPFSPKHVVSLPNIDMNECQIVLGILQILTNAFGLLSKECCILWTSSAMWLHFSKCFCISLSSIVNDSPEFERLMPDSQLFMLSQTFCCVCWGIVSLYDLPLDKQGKNCHENLFILCLDLISIFEKFASGVKEQYNDSIDNTSQTRDDSSSTSSTSSDVSSQGVSPGSGYLQMLLQISERLHEMSVATSLIPIQNYRDTLGQKLSCFDF
ncbi:uncharacterized protein LOC120346429 [Styela clava]